VNIYNAVTDRVIISPEGKSLPIGEMEEIFESAGAVTETIFRRLEFNQVIQFTRGVGIDIGCGLNKIHSAAIGIDFRLGDKDFGYPFGANIKVTKNKDWLPLPWFRDESVDFVFSSHCLEHFSQPRKATREILRVLKPGGYLVLILPDMRHYPKKGEAGANPDHEWDCYPEVLVDIVKKAGRLKVILLDTLHDKLKDVALTPRDKKIAEAFGHNSLNFSFEAVFQKLSPGLDLI
jgi:SAM-dependent methyltransferase